MEGGAERVWDLVESDALLSRGAARLRVSLELLSQSIRGRLGRCEIAANAPREGRERC
jgi:hypothetical protein